MSQHQLVERSAPSYLLSVTVESSLCRATVAGRLLAGTIIEEINFVFLALRQTANIMLQLLAESHLCLSSSLVASVMVGFPQSMRNKLAMIIIK